MKLEMKKTLESLYKKGLRFPDCVEFFSKKRTSEERTFVKIAQETEFNGIEIDDNAVVSLPETDETVDGPHKGAYVMAWVWVEKDE